MLTCTSSMSPYAQRYRYRYYYRTFIRQIPNSRQRGCDCCIGSGCVARMNPKVPFRGAPLTTVVLARAMSCCLICHNLTMAPRPALEMIFNKTITRYDELHVNRLESHSNLIYDDDSLD